MPKLEAKCAYCLKSFLRWFSMFRKHNFCSKACVGKYKTMTQSEVRHCENCHGDFKVINGNAKRRAMKFCSKPCFSEWKKENKSTWVGKDGYCRNSDGRLHREIYKKHHGVELSRSQFVHHINHNKTDNRIDNLEVLTNSEHSKLHYADIPKDSRGIFI